MKDNYSTEHEIALLELAKRWNITPEEVRRQLDILHDANFYDDLDAIDDYLTEKNAKYMEYATDMLAEMEIE